jgi:hypothetical protein
MTCRAQLRELQGRIVGLALTSGDRIDECHLISSAGRVRSVWVYANGEDSFIPVEAIRDCWEILPRAS